MAESNVNKVSRQYADPSVVEAVAKELEIATRPTDVEIKNEKGEVLKKVPFVTVLFEEGDRASEDKLAAAVAMIEKLFPAIRDKEGNVVRTNDPVAILLSHLSYSFDLTIRNGVRTKERTIVEGPDKEIEKQAKRLAAFKNISYAEALEKVKAAWL
jgi:hypothetical protein